MWSPSISPGSTRCSTWATVSLPAVAIIRIEVARRLPIDKIAFRVALPGVNQRDVGDEPGFHDIGLVVELADLLALGDHCADTGAGEEGGNAGPSGADALGKRSLRVEFKFELACEIHARKDLVLADIA